MQAKEVSQIEVKNDKFPEASAGAFLNLENLLKIEKKNEWKCQLKVWKISLSKMVARR